MNLFGNLRSTNAPPEFTPEDLALLNKLAEKVVRRRMTIPAVMFFESIKPMNFVGAQAMIFLQPFVSAFFSTVEYNRIRELLERRETLYKFVDILERQEDDFLFAEQQEAAAARAKESADRIARGLPAKPWWRRIFGSKNDDLPPNPPDSIDPPSSPDSQNR